MRDIKEIMELPIPEMNGLWIPVGFSIGTSYGNLKEGTIDEYAKAA